jgi:hypothetical protein
MCTITRMGLDRPARSRIMEQPIVYVGLNLQMDTTARHLPRHASEESCVALQGLKHAGAQAMPSSAPRAISLHFWHGRSGQRRPSASEFARGVVRAPVRGGCHGRASPIIPALVGDLSPKSNSMPSAAALRSISWSMAEPAPRWRQLSAIDMPNSPMRSAHESATEPRRRPFASVIVEAMRRVRVSRPLAVKARGNSDAGSSLAAPGSRLERDRGESPLT